MSEALGPEHPDDDVVEILHRIERKVDAGESLPAELAEMLAPNMIAFSGLITRRPEWRVPVKFYQEVGGLQMILEEATGWVLWRHTFPYSERRVVPPRVDG